MNIDFARRQMVNQQVRGWNVYDEDVLATLRELPREQFVPPQYKALAFADTEIAIGHGEHMMSPTVEGRVLQALGLRGSERVLEVGTGSGFLTACLARLAAEVTSIDIYDDFLRAAAGNLAACGISNVELQKMNAIEDLPDGGFDAIAVTGSLQTFDPRFVDALKPEGKLFVVVGDAPAMEAKLVLRTDDNDWETVSLFETTLAPLVDGALPPQFFF
ncbi:MAG: protein-L-isoaspartate O-methyltransferase [Gammaproteobacteria bacterium]|nr:protein-L-isoaspartate O-methyltransferase [Gammaproteobacteria bacterium]NND48108.1 protein-L-isoaspartate O-methyltransferase [Woeseiaceae bacterium]NNL45850.1 protein-L-isoaspartate O-methyltransferase [Woeseiaceae bacterium]